MRIDSIIQLTQLSGASTASNKVTKIGAGYVHRQGVDYRCAKCWKFIPSTNQCAEFSMNDVAKPNGTCTYWAFGTPVQGLKPTGAYTPAELGYTELFNGTKCSRCKAFIESGDCMKVDRNSPGDDPHKIDPDGCCANQTPRINT